MTTMKRFGLAALFAVGVSLLSGTPAMAQDWRTIDLALMVPGTDQDWQAVSQATINQKKSLGWYYGEWSQRGQYRANVTVTCRGLTPGATYRTTVGTFKADRYGNGQAKGWTNYYWEFWKDEFGGWVGPLGGLNVAVDRVNPDGTFTLVLSGADPYPI